MKITILAERLRIEERRLIEALAASGHQATLTTPADLGTTTDSRRVLVRLPAGPETAAIASALEGAGLQPIPNAQQLGLLSNRARVRRVLELAGVPLQPASVAIDQAGILDAIDQAGWPVEIVPLNASEKPIVAGDRDTAEAVVEHRAMLGGQRVLMVRPASHNIRRLLVIGETVIAASRHGEAGWIPDEVTATDHQIVSQVVAILGLDLLQIDLAGVESAVVEVTPLGAFRELQQADVDVAGTLADYLCPPESPAITIDPANPVELLTGLVGIHSTSGCEGKAVSWLVDQMAALGYQASIDPAGNAIGTRGEGPHEILLLGHIDTVTGEIPVRIEDGTLHGRGAVDAKGPLATFVAAGAQATLPEGVRLTIIGAVGEESLGSPGATWLRDHYAPPDAVIIGEPSGWDGLVLGYKGSIGFSASLSRAMSHSAGPEMTAPERLVRFWVALSSWLDAENQGIEQGFSSLDGTLRELSSNSDGLNETATMSVTFRLPPGTASASVIEAVDQIADSHDVQLDWVSNAEAYRVERRSPLVAPFLAAIRAAGGQPRLKVKTGTSDMNIVGPAWQCPIVAYGPGDASYDHRPDEQIPLADVERGVTVLTQAIETYASRLAGTTHLEIDT